VRSLGVAVAHPDPGVVDELVHALESEGDLYLALDPAKASVLLAGESALADIDGARPGGSAIVGVAADHDVARVARAALRCGAHEIVCWPEDRGLLRSIVRDAASRARIAAGRSDGRIVAVAGARGGVGTTTVAAMLARALPESAVVDFDSVGAGQSAFMADGAEPTLPDVVAAVEDLDPQSLAAAMSEHAAGRAVCSPPRGAVPSKQQAGRLVALLRGTVATTVFDLGRGADEAAHAVLAAADEIVCVCGPDVASMSGARTFAAVTGRAPRVVLNLASRMRLSARDVGRVLGARPVAVVPLDPAVRRGGESGRLPGRGPARRALDRLARRLSAEAADGS
jgi:pilus assembly protein CpaE